MVGIKSYFAPPPGEQGVAQAVDGDGELIEANPAQLARLLEADDESARRVLAYVDSVEAWKERVSTYQDLLPFLGVEGFGETVLEWLKQLILAMGDLIKEFMEELTAGEMTAQWMIIEAQNLMTMSRDRRSLKQVPFTVSTRVANLSIRYKPCKDNYCDHTLGPGIGGVLAVARNHGSAKELADAMLQKSPRAMIGSVLKPMTDRNGVGSGHILGNARLVLSSPESEDPVQTVRQTRLRVMPSDPNPPPMPTQAVFTPFNLSASDQCLKQVISLATLLKNHNTSSVRARRRDRLAEITRVMTQVTSQIQNATDDEIIRGYKQVVELLDQLSDWLSDPFMELYSLTCRNMRAAINVCNLNAR
jgi:hypothetical protein